MRTWTFSLSTFAAVVVAGSLLVLEHSARGDVPAGGTPPVPEDDGNPAEEDDGEELEQRAEWFLNQRSFPLGYIPADALSNANEQTALAMKKRKAAYAPGDPTWGHPGVINGWIFAGPQPINSGQTVPASNVTGRITSLAVDPSNSNHWYAGTAFGGVWETSNAGGSWSPKMDGVETLTIGALAIAPSNGQVIYAGTGESVLSTSYPGRGILVSTNGGASWTLKAESTFRGMSFSEIRVHPTDPQKLTATTAAPPGGDKESGAPGVQPYGVYRSTTGGNTWTKVLPVVSSTSVEATDLEVDPGNYNNQFAALSADSGYTTGSPPTTDTTSGVYRTTDGGDNWTKLTGPWDNTTNFPGGIGRIEMAMCSTDPNVLYVSIEDRSDPKLTPPLAANITQGDGGMLGMWKTINALTANPANITWTQIPTPSLVRTVTGGNQTFTPKNLWYAHQLIVDPNDSRVLYFGEVNMWKYDGRPGAVAKWTVSMNPLQVFGPVHSDQHAMAWTGGGSRLIIGNDGGVWYTDDGMTNWTNCNTNLNITQFYYGSIDPSNKAIAIAGAQDNGTSRHTGFLNWQWIGYGDGGESIISPTSPATHWAVTSQNLSISRTLTGSAPVTSQADWGINDNGNAGTNNRAPFISRIVVNPFNENIVIAGTDNVWRSNNFFSNTNPSVSNPLWVKNGPDMTYTSGGKTFVDRISALAFSQNDATANVYAFATGTGKLRITSDGGKNWTDLDPLGQVPDRYVTSLAFDPRNDQILYVTVSGFNAGTPAAPGHVFKTGNARNAQPTWTDLALPTDVPCNAVAIDAGQPHVIYVGTDSGLWQCEQQPGGGTDWFHYGPVQGVPNIPVMDLKFHRTGRRLLAFTHGRGLLVADLVPPNDAVGSAQTLLGLSGSMQGSNVNASHESGEPAHRSGTSGTHSIWYKWTPATGGNALVSTSGTNFHSVMAVYLNGGAENSWNFLNLPPAATADGANAQISFNATQGATYYIAIDGATANDVGEVTLGWSISDTTPPTVTITHPTANSSIQALSYISGKAEDGGGIDHVDLTINKNGDFWNGTAWVSTATAIRVPVSTDGFWSYYSLPTGGNARTGQYLVFAHAVDLAGNISPILTGVNSFNFVVDTETPTVEVSSPANGTTINTLTYGFSAKANDDTGLSRVTLFIRRASDFYYWNGSGWVQDPYQANLSSSYNAGNQTWFCTSALPVPGASLGNGAYTFIALAIDKAGNQKQADSNVTVSSISSTVPALQLRGDSLADASSPGHTVTKSSDVTFTEGRVGQGFNFPGGPPSTAVGSNAVVIADSADLKPTNLTLSAWVKFSDLTGDASGDQIIIHKQNNVPFNPSGYYDCYSLLKRDGKFHFNVNFAVNDGKAAISTTRVIAGRWYHVVATYDHQNMKLYVNGRLEAVTPETRNLDYANTPVTLGRSNLVPYFDGLFKGVMDEVQIFNTALTPTQIPAVDDANAGTGLVSWWRGEGNGKDFQGANDGGAFGAGEVGRAFQFDGTTNQYVLVGDPVPASLQIQNEISLDSWIYVTAYPDSNSLALIMGSQYDVTHSGASIFLDGRTNPDGQPAPPGHIHFQIGGDGTFHTTNVNAQVPLNQWVHIAATRKANEDAKVYYNGVLQPSTSVPWSGTISYDGAWFAIGRQKDMGRPFNGLIDELDVFNRALTQSEVQAIHAAGAAGKNPAALPAGLVSWWRGEDNANDAQGSSNGTLVKPEAYSASGKVGQAFSISPAEGNYLSIPDSPSLHVKTFTIDAWVNFNALPALAGHIFGKALGGGDANSYIVWYQGGSLHGYIEGGPVLNYPWSPTFGQWYHVAYTFDGSTHKLYVDGSVVASGTNTAMPSYDDHPALIGGDYSGGSITYFFDGKIDEVDLFDRALSGSEVNAIFTAGATGKSTGPRLSVRDAFAMKGPSGTSNMTFTVDVEHPNASPVTVDYATLDGSAMTPGDYATTTGTLSIPANTKSAIFTVPVIGNALPQSTQFFVRLTNATNAVINHAYGSGNIYTGNAVEDFDSVNNASAQLWQYGYSETGGGSFTNYEEIVVAPPFFNWHRPGQASDMSILFNGKGTTLDYNAGTHQPVDELAMFPGNDGRKSTVRWRAPVSGSYQIDGLFEGIEAAGGTTSTDATIVKNGDTAHPLHFDDSDATGINFVNGFGTQKPFSMKVFVNAGDTLDFRLGWGSNNNYSYDGTGLKATVSRILAPVITNAAFPFSGGQLNIVGGTGPYTVTVTSGALPDGLAISPSGLVTGVAVNGPYNFTLHIVDAAGVSSDQTLSGVLANPTSVPAALVAWWPAEGAVGDIIGNNHGSLQGGATYAVGKVGMAFSLDGAGSFVRVPSSSSLNPSGSFTIEAWIYPVTDGNHTIAGKWGDTGDYSSQRAYFFGTGSNRRLSFAIADDAHQFDGSFQAFSTSDDAINLNTWNHVAACYDQPTGTRKIYVNGALKGLRTDTGVTITSSAADLGIGARLSSSGTPVDFFTGMIDELSLYGRALSDSEISGIYASAADGKTRYDAARDFAQIQTAGSPWSSRWLPGSASMSSYDPSAASSSLLPGPFGPDVHGIKYFGGPSFLSFNPAESFVIVPSGGTQYDWAPHQLGIGPGSGSEFSVLRWKAPQSGIYAVSGTFFGCDTAPVSADIHIFHNASELTPAGKRYLNSYRGAGVSHTQTITVAANDTVDFVVGAGGNGYSYDSSGLAASIVPVSQIAGAVIAVEQPAGSSLSSDTSTVSFGSSNIGVEVQKTFVIKNTGVSALHLDSPPLSLDGVNNLDFFFDPPPVLTLAPGASTTFTASFVPVAMGAREAQIHIGSDSTTGSPFNIKLTGTGFSGVPHISVEQPAGTARANNATVDFSGGIMGGGVLQTFVIKNTGTALLSGVIATIDGANSADFSIIAAPTATVAPGSYTNCTVRFTASATSARTASLHIASNDAVSSPFNITLTGTASGTALNATFNSVSDVPLTTDGLNATGLTLSATLNFAPAFGTNLTLVNNTGTSLITGTFAGRPPGSTVSMTYGGKTYDFVITYAGGTGNDVMLLWPGSSPVGWGDNVYGRTGDGTTGGLKLSPVAAVANGALDGKTVIMVASGYQHSLALTADGLVFAWGRNDVGQLGDGTNNDSNEPVAVDASGVLAGKTVVSVTAGLGYSVALTSDGQVFSWGAGNYLGRGSSTNSNVPVAVDVTGVLAGKTVTDISASWYHVLVRTSDGRVFGWGNNGFGQLGNGNRTSTLSPVAMDVASIIASGETVKSISAGYVNSMILTAHNIMFICGDNSAGQLGLGTSNPAYPVATTLVVPNIGPLALSPGSIARVIAGSFQNYALTTDGRAIAWGYGGGGALGVSNPGPATGQSPVFVDMTGALNGKTIIALSAGVECAVALTTEGQLFSWGINTSGQLGNATTTGSDMPVAVTTSGVLAGRKVSSLSAAPYGCLAVASAPLTPSIVVQLSGGGAVVSSGGGLDLGTVLLGGSTNLTFTIQNTGNAPLTNLAVTATGEHPEDYSTGGPAATSIAPNASTTFVITFAPIGLGARIATIHVMSNDSAKSPINIPIIGTGGMPITTWRQDNFGTSANTGDAADNADPDHDGVPNLLEFALGGDPTDPAPVNTPVSPPDVNGVITFDYTRNREVMAEVVFQVEWTDNLLAAWQSSGVTETVLSDNGLIQQVRASVPAGPNNHRFVRLKVTTRP